MRIDSISKLQSVINDSGIAIYGTGWIAKLLYIFFINHGISKEKIEVIKSEKDDVLPWNIKTKDSVMDTKNPIVIAQKEDIGEKIAYQYHEIKEIYYISENLKNEIDSKMMIDYPSDYEAKVLNGRKKELDAIMSKKIGSMISNINKKSSFPIFDGIEFETINRCNGGCSFCPANKYDDPRPIQMMNENLFKKLVLELKEMDYRGRVAMYSNNEPFLDERIIDFTKYVRKQLPKVFLYIFTNGTLLDVNKFRSIISDIDLMCLDLYYDNYSELFSQNIKEILDYCENEKLTHKVMIQTINRKAIRNNRGGASKNRNSIYKPTSPCILPFIQMIVRPDGKVSLCCNDSLGEYTMADLNDVTIYEAWNGEKYRLIRKKLKDTRQNVSKCALCDNYSTINQNGNMIFTQTQIKDSWEAYKRLSIYDK